MIDNRLPVKWDVGEHVAVIGDTGSGKTFLMARLAQYRRYVVILRTKPDDTKFNGFTRLTRAKDLENVHAERIVMDLTQLRTMRSNQAEEAADVLDRIWRQTRWTLFVDEGFYVERKLGLGHELEMLLTQGRSLGISVVVGMQRPAWTTRFALSEPKHVFLFRMEPRDVKTVQDSTTVGMANAMQQLEQYQFAHYHRITRTIRIGEAGGIGGIIRIPPIDSQLSRGRVR